MNHENGKYSIGAQRNWAEIGQRRRKWRLIPAGEYILTDEISPIGMLEDYAQNFMKVYEAYRKGE